VWNLINIIGIRLGISKAREVSLNEAVDKGLKDLGMEPHPKRATYLTRKQMREAAEYIVKLTDGKFTEKEVIKELIRRGYTSVPTKPQGRAPQITYTEMKVMDVKNVLVPIALIMVAAYLIQRREICQ